MSTHLSPAQIQQYLRGGLSAEQLLTLDAHLVTCQLCQDQLQINDRLAASTASLRADFQQVANAPLQHLTWEQLAELTEQKLAATEQEMAESHLQICPACTAELAALRQFAEHLATFPVQEFAPPDRPSWRDKMLSFFGVANRSTAWKLLGAAALIVVIIGGGFRFWRARKTTVNAPEIATREPAPLSPGTTPSLQATPSETPVPAPVPPLLTLNAGGKQITLAATGQVEGINFAASADESLARNALRSGRLETPAELAQLTASASSLMGQSPDETFRLLYPTGKMIAATRPQLQWQALNGATEYVVTIANPQTNFIVSSEPLQATQWQPTKPLPRGQTYAWQVIALKAGKEIKAPLPDAPDAQFRILSQAQFAEVARAEKAYAGNHLMLGLIYARTGLLSAAESQFKALQAANPNSDIARQLLQRIRRTAKG